ncbi:MAG TPA: MFS transporter [Bryobacteraceae bacterium]|jgi:MFS family permease|nr:MFS transporter [Bryobacteraceae bacterium]
MQSSLSGRSSFRAAFSYPNFRQYSISRFLTTCSSEMQSVAVGWQIYELTHQPLDLGLVGLAQFLPGICLFLVAGHTIDRVPRLRVLKACFVGFAICSALLLALTLGGLRSAYPLYAVLLLNGVVRAFSAPAGQAFVPLLVATEDFPNAVAWSASIFQTATIAGPMIGGLLYGFTGNPIPVYATAAVAYFTAFLSITRIHLPPSARPRAAATAGAVLEGVRYIWSNKFILGAISLDFFAVLLGGAVALLPVYAREILKIGAVGLGILRSAPGVGAVTMSLVLAHFPLRRRAGLIMLWCVFGFGLTTVIFGLSHNFWLSLFMLFLTGATDTVSVIVRSTMTQLETPDEMRGRVSAVNMVFIGASNEVGQFESGITAQWFGTIPAVVIGGIGTMVVVALWSWMFPALRKLDALGGPLLEPVVSEATTAHGDADHE